MPVFDTFEKKLPKRVSTVMTVASAAVQALSAVSSCRQKVLLVLCRYHSVINSFSFLSCDDGLHEYSNLLERVIIAVYVAVVIDNFILILSSPSICIS